MRVPPFAAAAAAAPRFVVFAVFAGLARDAAALVLNVGDWADAIASPSQGAEEGGGAEGR